VSQFFRSWATLNQAVLANQGARFARAWFAARYVDKSATGRLTRSDFIAAIEKHLDTSHSAALKLLRDGLNGGWWWESGERIMLAGQVRLAERFGVVLGPGVDLPVKSLKSLRCFKAALFSSWFALKPRTVSLQTLSKVFGASKNCLRGWARVGGLRKKSQVGFTKSIEHAPWFFKQVVITDIDKDGQAEAWWRLPNRYSTRFKGFRVRQSNCGSLNKRASKERLYFDQPKAKDRAKALCKSQRGAREGKQAYMLASPHKALGRTFELVLV